MRKTLTIFAVLLSLCLNAQITYNPLQYYVEYLNKNGQTKSRGIADIGVVATENNYQTAFDQNPALLARNKHSYDFGFSYSPVTSFINLNAQLISLTGFRTLNKHHAIGVMEKYFSQGQAAYQAPGGQVVFNPFDYYTGISYAFSPIETFSIGMTGKYIISRQAPPEFGDVLHSYAFDIGADYREVMELDDNTYLRYNFAVAVNNIGPKVRYVNNSLPLFIPTNLRVGTMWSWKRVLDGTTSLTILGAYQAEKLLIPTPQNVDANNNNVNDWVEMSVFKGITSSFNDAPLGQTEELAEITQRLGVEVRLDMEEIEGYLALRGGRAFQNYNKGDDNYFTAGGTISYYGIYFDFAILRNQTLGSIQDPIFSFGLGYQIKLQ